MLRARVIFLAALSLTMMIDGLVFYSWYRYAEAHGGGVHHMTEDGRPCLNDHGRITLVSVAVYKEARYRFWRAWVVMLVAFLVIFVVGWQFRRSFGFHRQ